MANMTTAQKNASAKTQVVGMFVMPENTEQVGDFTYAVPTEVDGEERWVEVTFVAKANKATKVNDAYDPFEKQSEWMFEKEQKAKAAAERAATKAQKAERDKAARAKREAEKAKAKAEREAAQSESGEGV